MNEPIIAQAATNDRVIRVFISSTFRDMMRERDLLVKEVFPELRRKCAKRFVTFTEVDLRWGITEAQANEGQVLPLCLAEIERSRPYFIGLLGERYGWIPDTIRPEVIEREPWLKQHVQGRTSVTELEILHGVLNNPKMQSHAFFYFRDPAYVNDVALTDKERRDMVERDIPSDVERYGPAEAIRRTEERKTKLTALKQRIRDSKLPLVEPYANPKALADIVRQQFDELVDRLYPEDQTPDPLTLERMAHEAHARNKLFACIERHEANTLAEMVAYLDDEGVVVTGASGVGKTVLLAAFARDWAKSHPEDFLFQHYFGATPDSTSPEGFLRRLLGELQSRFGITDAIPTDPEKLRYALPIWLAQTIGKGRIMLVLDGLNYVQDSNFSRDLDFCQGHVTVIASTRFGPSLDGFRSSRWSTFILHPPNATEVSTMIDTFLSIHGRSLSADLRQAIISWPCSNDPLILRTLLEELRQFGDYEGLRERIAYYMKANDSPVHLFHLVLLRWQEDYDGTDTATHDLVHRALTHLWASRIHGIAESEWLDLMGANGLPLPRALWTPFFLALEPYLSYRAGYFVFGHNALFSAIYWPGDDAYLTLADYFESHPNQREMTSRKATVLPYLLHEAKAWNRLETCLTDIPLFLALLNDKKTLDMTNYWRDLRHMGHDMASSYTIAYNRWMADPVNKSDHFTPSLLGKFLLDNDLYPAAEPMLKQALGVRERVLGAQHPETARTRLNLITLLERVGRCDEATRLRNEE